PRWRLRLARRTPVRLRASGASPSASRSAASSSSSRSTGTRSVTCGAPERSPAWFCGSWQRPRCGCSERGASRATFPLAAPSARRSADGGWWPRSQAACRFSCERHCGFARYNYTVLTDSNRSARRPYIGSLRASDVAANAFAGKSVLVTGGTGSFGRQFVSIALKYADPKRLIVLSRDEMKQGDMAREFGNDPRLRFFLGDVRDRDRLRR